MANLIDFFRKKRKKVEKIDKNDLKDHKIRDEVTVLPDGQKYPHRPIGSSPLGYNQYMKATKMYEDQLNEKQFGQMDK